MKELVVKAIFLNQNSQNLRLNIKKKQIVNSKEK